MNPAKIALDRDTVTWVVIVLLLLGGIQAYMTMPRLEDGDTIAILGVSNLTEGMKVRPLGD